MDNFSITKNGEPLDESLYSIDLDNKTFSSKEDDLVLDFTGLAGWTFHTGWNCTFITGSNCTVKAGNCCTFNTGDDCKFKTGSFCTFHTSDRCTFDTGNYCTFMLWDINTCKFKYYDGISTILDLGDNKHYLLTKELVNMLKIANG